jgi:hypothetical protein
MLFPMPPPILIPLTPWLFAFIKKLNINIDKNRWRFMCIKNYIKQK